MLLEGFYKVFTRFSEGFSQGFYKAVTRFSQGLYKELMSCFYKASTMCRYEAFRRLDRAFVRILLFLYKDSTILLKCIYKVFTKISQCVYIFPQGSYKAMFYTDFRLFFARCFTRLLYVFYVLFIRFL
jgi:hypothetical protein